MATIKDAIVLALLVFGKQGSKLHTTITASQKEQKHDLSILDSDYKQLAELIEMDLANIIQLKKTTYMHLDNNAKSYQVQTKLFKKLLLY